METVIVLLRSTRLKRPYPSCHLCDGKQKEGEEKKTNKKKQKKKNTHTHTPTLKKRRLDFRKLKHWYMNNIPTNFDFLNLIELKS